MSDEPVSANPVPEPPAAGHDRSEQAARAERPLRADAARNRARLLEVAHETFAAEGSAVPVDEIARRAGVGPGTLYRHFPTKEALFAAIVGHRVDVLAAHGRDLAAARGPGAALFGLIARVVEAGAADQGLVDALAAGTSVDGDLTAVLDDLVESARAAGELRADVATDDVRALLVGCQAAQRYSKDADVTARVLDVVRAGLAPR